MDAWNWNGVDEEGRNEAGGLRVQQQCYSGERPGDGEHRRGRMGE